MREIYRSEWFNLKGYLACTVKYDNGLKKTILQHREIMENHLKRKLKSSELVHHKDGNKRNNNITNLEIISRYKHSHIHKREIEWTTITCINCGEEKEVHAKNERRRQKDNRNGPFCGKPCVGSWVRKEQIKQGKINLRKK